MKSAKTIAGIMTVFLTMPIWYYLLYKILGSVNASELMWFLYWIYLPAGFFIQIVARLTEGSK